MQVSLEILAAILPLANMLLDVCAQTSKNVVQMDNLSRMGPLAERQLEFVISLINVLES
jgi:hypothetical protein